MGVEQKLPFHPLFPSFQITDSAISKNPNNTGKIEAKR